MGPAERSQRKESKQKRHFPFYPPSAWSRSSLSGCDPQSFRYAAESLKGLDTEPSGQYPIEQNPGHSSSQFTSVRRPECDSSHESIGHLWLRSALDDFSGTTNDVPVAHSWLPSKTSCRVWMTGPKYVRTLLRADVSEASDCLLGRRRDRILKWGQYSAAAGREEESLSQRIP